MFKLTTIERVLNSSKETCPNNTKEKTSIIDLYNCIFYLKSLFVIHQEIIFVFYENRTYKETKFTRQNQI